MSETATPSNAKLATTGIVVAFPHQAPFSGNSQSHGADVAARALALSAAIVGLPPPGSGRPRLSYADIGSTLVGLVVLLEKALETVDPIVSALDQSDLRSRMVEQIKIARCDLRSARRNTHLLRGL